LEVWLVPGKTIVRGTVFDKETEEPIANALVQVGHIIGLENCQETKTTEKGFEIVVPPGRKEVLVSAEGYEEVHLHNDVESGKIWTVKVPMRRINTAVSGTCIDFKTKAPLKDVELDVFANSWPAFKATSDDRGSYTCKVPAGTYKLVGRREGYRPFIRKDVKIREGGDEIRVVMVPISCQIAGRVIDKATGKRPEQHCEAEIRPLDVDYGHASFFVEYPQIERHRESATFETQVAPGKFRVEFKGSGQYLAFVKDIQLHDGDQHEIEVLLEARPPLSCMVQGKVVDEDGQPLANFTVVAVYKKTNMASVRTKEDGSFEVKAPAGDVTLNVYGFYQKGDVEKSMSREVPVRTVEGKASRVTVTLK
jgi:hypothetical protein